MGKTREEVENLQGVIKLNLTTEMQEIKMNVGFLLLRNSNLKK